MRNESLYNSRLIKIYVDYLAKHYPNLDTASLLNRSRIATYEVEDKAHWFTQEQVDLFYGHLREDTSNPDIAREAGRYAVFSEASSSIRQYALGFITPAGAYRMLDRIASTLSRAHRFETKQLGGNQVEVIVTLAPGVRERPYQCENRIGMFEAMARIFTHKFAKVEHPECMHRGDDRGRYVISWDKSKSMLLRRMLCFAALMGGVASVALLFVLPLMLWFGFLAFCFLFSMSLLTAVFIFEKRDLLGNLHAQGDTAQALIEEIRMRYDSALLVQEIGHATSTVLDVEKLICMVVEIMERRLDFDRGMIMLADPEKTRLMHMAGYGYVSGHKELLQGTEFHLDNPASKGVFVVAFKERKPILMNDLGASESSLSRRSLEVAKKMGVHSLIAVPIVYEDESLGILAVDNVRSKRPLTQSDMSLLMGVASQTAVSIVNARSFQKLQESEKRYRELVENANSIILRMDPRGAVTFFNEFAQKFFGYSEKDILGRCLTETILPNTPEIRRSLENLVGIFQREPQRQVVGENQTLLKTGETAWIAWTYRPIFDRDGDIVEILCIGNDITELRKTGQEKRTLEAQLQEAQKMEAVGTLAGGIAHDFNNILQGIFSTGQIMLRKCSRDDPEYERLQLIDHLVRRASDLTKRLLIFSRKVESELKPLDLNQEVLQICKVLERTIPKMIHIELNLAADLDTINADPVQIEQIIMNLGVNARDAMPDGGRLMFKTENVDLNSDGSADRLGMASGRGVRLSVMDTGTGMSHRVRERIFEPFFTTKEQGKGTGLGLSVVYGIVKSHGGHIDCESRQGKGSIFRIVFPALTSEDPDARGRETEEQETPLQGGSGTILLVDDEESIRKPAEEFLHSLGYRVLPAGDGESACRIFEEHGPEIDLVILDLIMPGMGGRRCLERLLEMDPSAKIVVASGHTAGSPTKTAFERGARGFIAKPFELKALLETIQGVLENP